MRLISIYLITFAFAVLFSSCKEKENNDVIAPSLKTVTINNQVRDISVNPGDQMKVVIAANDNIKLSELKLSIHDAFDGHGHNKKNVAWQYSQVIPVSGTSSTKEVLLDVPEDAASGPYHLTVLVLDAAGNQGKLVERLFNITGEGQPVISVTEPDFTNGFTVAAGDSIILRGTVTDDLDLAHVEVFVLREGAGTGEAPIYEENFILPGIDDTEFNFSELDTLNKKIFIPSNATPGEYEILIKAKDSDGNYTFAGTEFDVIE